MARTTPFVVPLLAVAGLLSAPALAQDAPLHEFQAPPLAPLGPADLHVHPDGYRVGEGRLISAQYPLLRAIEAAEAVHAQDGETVVIDVHGAIPAPRRSRFAAAS